MTEVSQYIEHLAFMLIGILLTFILVGSVALAVKKFVDLIRSKW